MSDLSELMKHDLVQPLNNIKSLISVIKRNNDLETQDLDILEMIVTSTDKSLKASDDIYVKYQELEKDNNRLRSIIQNENDRRMSNSMNSFMMGD